MQGVKGTAMSKEERLERNRQSCREYYQKNKEAQNARCKEYYKTNTASSTERAIAWHKRNPERWREINREWRANNPDKVSEMNKRSKFKLKYAALSYYSKGEPFCACCGEKHINFLTIDHINNDGAEHRRKEPQAANIHKWLKANKYPEGFQVLCFNCNMAKGFFGVCPHQMMREDQANNG